MSDITLDRVDALGDYLTDEVYEVQFVTLPAGITGITAEDINLRCNTFTLPDLDVNMLSVTHRTFTKEQPTHFQNQKDISFTMIETMTPKTLPFLREWLNRQAKKGTNYVYPPAMRQAEIMVYHKKNDKTVAWVWNCKNCQLKMKTGLTLGDGSSPAAVIPTLTIGTMLIREGANVTDLQ